MAINIGTLEAIIRLKDEMSTQLHGIDQKVGGLSGTLLSLGKAFGVGFGMAQVVSFGRAIFDDADALVKLSDQTAISIGGLQRLRTVGDDAGNSFEELTGAVSRMQVNLGKGDEAVQQALRTLSLSVSTLKGLAPEQQFMAIADAIRLVRDPTEQARLAVELFGRAGTSILPTIKQGFDDVRDASIGMSDETVRALDRAGDTLTRFWRGVKSDVGSFLGDIVGILSTLGGAIDTVVGTLTEAGNLIDREILGATATVDELAKTLEKMAQKAERAAPKMKAIAPPGLPQDLRDIYDALENQHDALKRTTEAATKFADEYKKSTADVKALERNFFGLWETVGHVDDRELELVRTTVELNKRVQEIESSARIANFGFKGMTGAVVGLGEELRLTDEELAKSIAAFGTIGPELDGAKAKLTSLSDVFTGFPSLLVSAFTGGGGLSGAIKGLGVQIGTNLFGQSGLLGGVQKTITGGLTKAFGEKLGGALGAAIPGVGALIGPAISLVWSGIKKLLGGPSEQELQGREAVAQAEMQLRGLLTAQQRLEAGGSRWKETVIGVRDAYLATGRSSADAEAAAKNLWDSSKQGAEAVKAAMEPIQAAFDLQRKSQEALNDAISRYKFTTEELGPALANQKLSEQAQKLFKDWQVLTQAGINIAAVGREMQASINAFWQTSVKAGQEIDVAMRPMLQHMLDMGLLTDEDGKKVKSFEDAGIKFSLSMSEGFKEVVKSVKELTDTLRRGLGLAIDETTAKINNIPREIHVRVFGHNMTFPDPAAVSPSLNQLVDRLVHFQGGTGGRLLNFGRGTPVMLHGRERVQTEREVRAAPEGHPPSDNLQGVLAELRGLRRDMTFLLPGTIARATTVALVKAGVG